ncbi:MAG: O-antigen ligase family protein [Candidatus Moraniibacteriota bacterium]
MEINFEKIIAQLSKNAIKLYLILANVLLTVFAIWFSNVGLLPFKNFGDFVFFVILALVFAIYRPGWAFVLFVGMLALENVNLAPTSFGLAVRPYQLLGALILLAIALRFLMGRKVVTFPKLKFYDGLPLLFALGGFVSAFIASNKGSSLKQAIVAASFVALYFLVRFYVQSLDDLKRITSFFLSSSCVVAIYAIWQNARFAFGKVSFEVMAGRPNGTFTEPDWLGIYLAFLLASLLVWLFYISKNYIKKESRPILNLKFEIFNQFFNIQIFKKIVIYTFITLVMVALILTVSRSAWLGALLIVLGFLKINLLYSEKIVQGALKKTKFWEGIWQVVKRPWNWKQFLVALKNILIVGVVSLGIVFIFRLTNFQLASRAQSTNGMQKITIACDSPVLFVNDRIESLSDLAQHNCWHINLEEIVGQKAEGKFVQEVYRPDPNVGIRAKIYGVAFEQIKQHSLLGIGWGSISNILGTDERGAGLNASNIFLEIWLGSGLLGFLSFVILLGYIFVSSCGRFVATNGSDVAATFILFGLFAIFIPNLFNSGIFLGFVWVFLAIAVGLSGKKN